MRLINYRKFSNKWSETGLSFNVDESYRLLFDKGLKALFIASAAHPSSPVTSRRMAEGYFEGVPFTEMEETEGTRIRMIGLDSGTVLGHFDIADCIEEVEPSAPTTRAGSIFDAYGGRSGLSVRADGGCDCSDCVRERAREVAGPSRRSRSVTDPLREIYDGVPAAETVNGGPTILTAETIRNWGRSDIEAARETALFGGIGS